MSTRNILISLGVLILLLGLYLWMENFSKRGDPYTKPKENQYVAELKENLKPVHVQTMTLKGKGNKDGSYSDDETLLTDGEVTITKEDGKWILQGLYSYPADKDKVQSFITKLMKIDNAELVGKTEETQKECEVDTNKGKTVAVKNATGDELCNVTLGKTVPGSRDRTFARFENGETVYSINPSFSSWEMHLNGAPKEWPENWMDKTLIEFDSEKGEEVKKVEVAKRSGERYTLEKVEIEKEVPVPAEENKEAEKTDDNASGDDKDKEAEENKTETKTVTETKWFVTAKEERFEPDSSKRSSFTGAFDNLNGASAVDPVDPVKYGLDPAYATITVTTAFTKDEFKDRKGNIYTILLGDRVPEEQEEEAEEAEEDAASEDKTADEEAGKTETDDATSDAETTDDNNAESEDDAEKPEADTEAKAEEEKDKGPKLTDDRYITIKGDRRIMTLSEWKLKSIDKMPKDFKKEEKKKEPKEEPKEEPKKEEASAEELGAKHILISYKMEGKDNQELDATRTRAEAETKAEDLLKQIKEDPSKFAELAKEWSDCPSKDKGGDLGTFAPDKMVPAFTKALQKLKIGEISDLVETKFGFHIIKRTK